MNYEALRCWPTSEIGAVALQELQLMKQAVHYVEQRLIGNAARIVPKSFNGYSLNNRRERALGLYFETAVAVHDLANADLT
jgi:hypothetical protein